MLYSLDYHTKYKQEADELRAPWNQGGQLKEYLSQEKRFLITDITNSNLSDAIKELDKIKDAYNYTVSCGDLSVLLTLLDEGYNAFLRYPITDWESYQNLAAAGVSDIYIDGPLAFNCKNIAASKGDIKIRVSPQVSANASLLPLDVTANTFFIRPEDLKIYEDAIDIIDFKEKDQQKEDTLFKIYKRGTWPGDLRDLIGTVHESVPNPFLKPEFGQSRYNCGQICKIPGRSCHLCQTQFSLTNLVVDYFSEKNEEN